ncbi:DUF2274 domain-containing protein [Sphingomonas sp. URHD0057]|uniref:DUF2274 domain-containing protein n=1 Tax=Sphingomonas sp. URHD0057 TaxID=1380389 RepID=UPI000AD525AE
MAGRTPVKITVTVSPELNQALGDYSQIYGQAYGEPEPVQELIPAMLASFLESDRGFMRLRKKGGSS